MHKSKKKSKSTKIPKPIKIKKEKTEEDRTLHPMSHYIDDRLELVKQIFGTLKPKTITNLAPDFLKKKNMEEIEELCLHELLCISTKRLHSIINATKCPTDTESSSDSDVERHEEHISLEEISSDSEIEGSSNAVKRKSTESGAKTGAKKETKNAAEKDENDGQISVLELLELQARARAIRSQLALEPVTKIEVDSDDQNEGKRSTSKESGKDKRHGRTEHKRKLNERERELESGKSRTSSTGSANTGKVGKTSEGMAGAISKEATKKDTSKPEEKQSTKKIKLKRNYRKINQGSQDNNNTGNDETNKTQSVQSTTNEVKQEHKSRSPSPDVIPIVAEPETLMISDSSDDESTNKVVGIKTTTKEPEVKEATVIGSQAEPNQNAAVENTIDTVEEHRKERKLTEPEEGEITENEVEKTEQIEKLEAAATPPTAADTKSNEQDDEVSQNNARSTQVEMENVSGKESVTTATEKIDDESRQSSTTDNSTQASVKMQVEDSNTASNMEEDDDQNDDIISIEGGDLESEMIEHLEEESNTKSSLTNTTKKDTTSPPEQDADIISLDSSEDESNKDNSESWHSRYLKSSKVSKVLLTSRLGKRVRDKIKKSKRSKTDSEHESTNGEMNKTSNVYSSKHEDGSIEQYKELLEMRQRKN